MVLRFHVTRSPDQNESRFTAPPAWRETLAEQASHFMLLCMDGIVHDPIDSGMRHGVPRLELSANWGHGSISVVWICGTLHRPSSAELFVVGLARLAQALLAIIAECDFWYRAGWRIE